MHILFFILISIFVIVLIVFSLFRSIVRLLFGGLFRKRTSNSNQRGDFSQNQHDQTEQSGESEKVFSKDEGEYVKYEEIE